MKPVPCPNDGCKVVIQRQRVSDHVCECPHTVIPCKYKGIGCANRTTSSTSTWHWRLSTCSKVSLTPCKLELLP
jgi:hypothetical protein